MRYTLGDAEVEGIILGENPAGHCFVLRDLIPINFFKYVMIVKLKMRVTCKIFGKICLLKTIRDTFRPSMWSAIKRGKGWDIMPFAWNRLVLMPTPETDYQYHNRNIYISEIRSLLKTYSQKYIYLLNLLKLYIAWIVMFLDLQTQRLATNINYSPLATLQYYFTNLSLFWGKMYSPLIFGTPTFIAVQSHLLCVREK